MPNTELFWRASTGPLFKILDFGVGEFVRQIDSASRDADFHRCLCTRRSTETHYDRLLAESRILTGS